LVFNQQGRDVGRLLAAFNAGIVDDIASEPGVFDLAIFTRNDQSSRAVEEPERDLTVQKAAAEAFSKLYPNVKVLMVDNTADAVKEARSLGPSNQSPQKTLVLVTGSLHLVGAMLRTLEPEALI
jgi:folylpolyglutamate synthase